jgi:hypothetical protein
MKKLKIYYLALFLLAGLTFVSCEKDSDELTGNAELGGEVIFKSENLGYVVGNGKDTDYIGEFSVFQGPEKIESIDIYKTFSTKDQEGNIITSNKNLVRTITIPTENQHISVPFAVTYNQLIQGLTINGSALSSDDGSLQIGDYWTLSFVSHVSNGLVHENSHNVKISVGTRFSGTYKCVEATYYRIGVLTYTASDWPVKTVIESIDATTYKVNDYLGPFNANTYYFTIDSNDKISIPAFAPDGVTANVGNEFQLISCQTNPNDLSFSKCGTSNVVIRDDINGKDQLKMTFGYIGSGGSREFYQVLEKIVE